MLATRPNAIPASPVDTADGSVGATRRIPWHAALKLGYQFRAGRTVPSRREHYGPLRVLKGYRQSGTDCWEQVVVHPPGGIASCDELRIDIDADQQSQVLLTTPGATKWYRADVGGEPSRGLGGLQTVSVRVASGASAEWMPLENIFYDGADARLDTEYLLAPDAGLICAEVYCLGRPAAQAPFEQGRLRVRTRVMRDGRPLYIERINLAGGDRAFQSQAALGGHACFGALVAAPATKCDLGERVSQVRQALSDEVAQAQVAVTALPEVLIVRWRGPNAQAGWRALHCAWRTLRLPVLGRAAQAPRIWAC